MSFGVAVMLSIVFPWHPPGQTESNWCSHGYSVGKGRAVFSWGETTPLWADFVEHKHTYWGAAVADMLRSSVAVAEWMVRNAGIDFCHLRRRNEANFRFGRASFKFMVFKAWLGILLIELLHESTGSSAWTIIKLQICPVRGMFNGSSSKLPAEQIWAGGVLAFDRNAPLGRHAWACLWKGIRRSRATVSENSRSEYLGSAPPPP